MTGRPGRIQSLSRSLTPEPPKALTPRLVGSASGARTAPGSSDPVLSTCRRPLPQHHADQESSRRYAVSMGSVRFVGVSSSWPHGLCVSNKEPSPQKRAIAVASRRTRDGARRSLTRQGLWMHAPRADEARAGEPLHQPRSRAARRQKACALRHRRPPPRIPTLDGCTRGRPGMQRRRPAGRRHSGQHPAPIPTYPRIPRSARSRTASPKQPVQRSASPLRLANYTDTLLPSRGPAKGRPPGGSTRSRHKSSRCRADAQWIVTTRLLYHVHDPTGRPSRLQGIHPRAR